MNDQATVSSENSVTRKLLRNSYSVIRHFKRDAEKTQFLIKSPQWIPVLKNVKTTSTKLTLRLVHKKSMRVGVLGSPKNLFERMGIRFSSMLEV